MCENWGKEHPTTLPHVLFKHKGYQCAPAKCTTATADVLNPAGALIPQPKTAAPWRKEGALPTTTLLQLAPKWKKKKRRGGLTHWTQRRLPNWQARLSGSPCCLLKEISEKGEPPCPPRGVMALLGCHEPRRPNRQKSRANWLTPAVRDTLAQ